MDNHWLNDALFFVSIGATIVVGVVVLWLFFDVRTHVKRRLQEKTGLIVRKLPDFDTPGTVRVLLKDGKTYAGLRLVGVIDDAAAREVGLPYPLTHLCCFDREDGARIWIDASAIRVIETMHARDSG